MSDTELDEAAGPSLPKLILPAEEPEIPAAVPAGLQDKLQYLRSSIKSDLSGRQVSASLCSPRFSERPLASPRSNSSTCATPRSARGLSSFGLESRQETPRALLKASVRQQLGTGTSSPEPQGPSSAGRNSSDLPDGLGGALPEPRFPTEDSPSPATVEVQREPPRPLLQAFLQLPTFKSYCNTRRTARLSSLPSKADRAAAATGSIAEQLAARRLQEGGPAQGPVASWQPLSGPSSNIRPSGFSTWGMEGGAASSSRSISPASRQRQQQEGASLAELARSKRANISLAPPAPVPAAGGWRSSSGGGGPASPGKRPSSAGWGPALNLRPPSPKKGTAAVSPAGGPAAGGAIGTLRGGLATLELTRHATSSSSNTLRRLGSRPASPSAAAAPRVPGSPGASGRYASSSSWGAALGILSAQQHQQRRVGTPASSRPVALVPSPASQLNIRPPGTSVTRLRSAAVTDGVTGVTRTKPGPELQQLQVVVHECEAGDAAAAAAAGAEEAAAAAAEFGVAPWGPADVLLCSPHSPGMPGIKGVHYSPWPLQLSAADAAAVRQAAFAAADDTCSAATKQAAAGASCHPGFDQGPHAAAQLSMLDSHAADGSSSAPDSPARQRLLRQDSASSPGHHERHRKLPLHPVADAAAMQPAPDGPVEQAPEQGKCPQRKEPAQQQQQEQESVRGVGEARGVESQVTPVHMQHASGTWLEGGLLGSSISRSREAPRLEPMQLMSPYSSTASALFSRQDSLLPSHTTPQQHQQQRPPSRGLLLDSRAPGSSSGSRWEGSLLGGGASTTPGSWLSMTAGPSLGSGTGYGNRSSSSRSLLDGGSSLLQGGGGAAGASSSTPGYFNRTAPAGSAAGSSRSASPALLELESGVWARSMRSREPDAGSASRNGGWFSSTGTRSQTRQGNESTAPTGAGTMQGAHEGQERSIAAAASGHAGEPGRPAAFWSAPGDIMNSLSSRSGAGTRGAAIAAGWEAAASASQGAPAGLSSTGYAHSSSGRARGSPLGYLDAQLRQLSSPKTSFSRSGLNLSLQPRGADMQQSEQQRQQADVQQQQQQQQPEEQEENIYITLLPPPAYAGSQGSTPSEVEGDGGDQAEQEDGMQEAAGEAAAPGGGASSGRPSNSTSISAPISSSSSSRAHLHGSGNRGQGSSGLGAASAAVAAALGVEGRESTAGAAAVLLSNSGAPPAAGPSGLAAAGSRCHRQHQLQQAAAAEAAPGTASHPSSSRARQRSSSVVAAAAEAAKVLADEEEAEDVDKRAMHAYLCNRFVRQRQGRIMCRVLTAWWRLSAGRAAHGGRRSSTKAMQVIAGSPTRGSLLLSDTPAGLTLDCSAVCRPMTASGAPGDEFHLSGTAVLRLVCSPGPSSAQQQGQQQLAGRGAVGGDNSSDASSSDMGDSPPNEEELAAMLQDRQGLGVSSSRPGSVAWAGLLPGQGSSSGQAGSAGRAPGNPTKQLRLLQQVQEMINRMEDIVCADEPATVVLTAPSGTLSGNRQQQPVQPQGRRPGSAAAVAARSGSPVKAGWTEPAASTDGSKGAKGPLPSSPGAGGRRLTQTALQQRLKHIQARVGTIELKMLQAAALADTPSYGNSSKCAGCKGQPAQRASSKQQQLVARMQEEMAALEQELLQMQAEIPRVYG